jgi:hypothetical protein
MIKAKFTFTLVLGLLVTAAAVVAYVVFATNSISDTATAQPLTESLEGIDTARNDIAENQTVASTTVTSNLTQHSNPNLGFTLEYPSDWQKEETLSFVSPQGGIDNRTPEVISITTEVLPTSDFSLDRYSEAGLRQVESFQDFKLLNSSSILSTILGFETFEEANR